MRGVLLGAAALLTVAVTACSSSTTGHGTSVDGGVASSSAPASAVPSSTAPSSSAPASSTAPSSGPSSSAASSSGPGGSASSSAGSGDWTTSVNFATVAYPGLDCSGARDGNRVDVLKVVKGDLTGDGVVEAVVRVECAHEASEWPDSVYVLSKGPAGPQVIGTLVSQSDDEYASAITISGHSVTLSLDGYSAHAPGCCPDLHYTQTDTWNGSSFDLGPKTSTLHQCGDSAFAISHSGDDGAAGHVSVVLRFKNQLSQACTVRGYPGLDALSSSGGTLAHATRTLSGYAGGAHAIETLTVAPGASVSAVVEWTSFNTSTGGSCTVSAGIATTPPNTSDTVELPIQVTICNLQVHPVVAGTSGRS